MADWKFLYNEFKKYGINDYQCWEKVIPLDNVFGLDEKRHNDGTQPYGVSSMSLFDRGVIIQFYKGNIFKPTCVCSKGRLKECGSKNKRLLTEEESQGIYDYCMLLINERKEQIEKNKYWIDNFDKFVKNCLSIAQKYVVNNKTNCVVEISEGSSIADKRVAPALVFCNRSNGAQRGYIKIFQNKYGDISLDACSMGHTIFDVKDPNDIVGLIGCACRWCI